MLFLVIFFTVNSEAQEVKLRYYQEMYLDVFDFHMICLSTSDHS